MTTHSMTTILGASKDAVFYKVYKDENNTTKLNPQINDISDYSANILITSPIFELDTVKARAYDDSKYNLTNSDYQENSLNKKIDDMLNSDDNEDIKKDILEELNKL